MAQVEKKFISPIKDGLELDFYGGHRFAQRPLELGIGPWVLIARSSTMVVRMGSVSKVIDGSKDASPTDYVNAFTRSP